MLQRPRAVRVVHPNARFAPFDVRLDGLVDEVFVDERFHVDLLNRGGLPAPVRGVVEPRILRRETQRFAIARNPVRPLAVPGCRAPFTPAARTRGSVGPADAPLTDRTSLGTRGSGDTACRSVRARAAPAKTSRFSSHNA